jgi:acyl carrier protein
MLSLTVLSIRRLLSVDDASGEWNADRAGVKVGLAPAETRCVGRFGRATFGVMPWRPADAGASVVVAIRPPVERGGTQMPQDVVNTATDLEGQVREIVADELELADGELNYTADFVDDYGADSLSLITVIARFEKELGIAVPIEGRAELVNL